MIRRLLVWSIALLLITSVEARERTPLEQAKKIAPGSFVVVTLKNRQFRTGYLKEVAQDRFTLGASLQGDWSGEVLFQDVEKIRKSKARWTIKEILLMPVYFVWGLGYILWSGGLPIPY